MRTLAVCSWASNNEAMNLSPKPRLAAWTKLWCAASATKLGTGSDFGEMGVVAQVLLRVGDRELEAAEIALEHLAEHHLEDAGVDAAGRDHLVQLGERQAALGGDRRRFGDRRRHRHRQHVVDELQHVAVARLADVEDVLAERLQHRLERLEVGGLGADHGVEAAFLGLLRRARQRRVDVARSLGGEVGADARRRRRLGGRRVDDDEAGARGLCQAAFAPDDVLDLRRARDADEDDVGRARDLDRARCLARAGRDQVGEALAVAVRLERQRIALGEQVLRHAVAHHADADEADPWGGRHAVSLRAMGGAAASWRDAGAWSRAWRQSATSRA